MARPFRPNYISSSYDWFKYGAIAVIAVVFIAFIVWCGHMAEQECRDHGGDHMVSTGRYTSLCISADGRVVEW